MYTHPIFQLSGYVSKLVRNRPTSVRIGGNTFIGISALL